MGMIGHRNARSLRIVFLCTALGCLVGSIAEEQQNYYSIRRSKHFIAPTQDAIACTGPSAFPPPYCPSGDDVTLSMFNWTSIETKAVAVKQTGAIAVGYDCVTYSVCGYRVYDSTTEARSDPQQFRVVRASVPLLQQVNSTTESQCLSFPSADDLCPTGRERRSLHNVTSQELVGLAAHNGNLFGQFECATYAICGYRIFSGMEGPSKLMEGPSKLAAVHTQQNIITRRRLQSSVPQQFLKVQSSLPMSGVGVFPTPVNCKNMHFFLSQTNHHTTRLRATAIVDAHRNSSQDLHSYSSSSVKVIGLVDYVSESLCGYANPPHHVRLPL